MKPFQNLTQRGQARRLRQLALNALQSYPLRIRNVSLLAYHFNCIFRVDTQDGQKYALRINLPGVRSLAEIRSEAMWLAALRQDTDLLVPEPLQARNGELVVRAGAPGVPERRHCVVFGWVAGRDLHHQMTPENYARLGRFTARLHDHAKHWRPPSDFELRTHDEVLFIDREKGPLWAQDDPALLPTTRAAVFRQVHEQVGGILREIYRENGPPSVLHADLHQFNVRLLGGEMCALDFDDCLLGHFVQDLGISLYYAQGHENYPALREAHRKGYQQLRPWPETQIGQVEAIIAGREFQLCQHLYFGSNPAYKTNLPGFFTRAEARMRRYLERFS